MMNLSAIITSDVVKIIHDIVSVSFLLLAVTLIYRSVRGIKNQLPYAKTDKYVAIAFIVALYLQLILGLIMFTNLGSGFDFQYIPDESNNMVAKRLWPVEHIVLMLFALFIANLGLISSFLTKQSRSRFIKILVYYSVSVVLIAISLLSIYA
ncbi:hypothetical protein [Draconibacterium sediminis]|uniref:Cytochrome b561 bacterial/Ni-hydrogenase domain-containing protein n=1 Tax=Draconibacterium sediminis TaxID=1544798 RepID=A0A0D8J9Z5_9BACT|nr:hypothetical protein [Draconibacterium sediminis]KJF42623.1 hypothetical protein LH29_18965 [Draconibacterium sediminis]